MKRGLIALIVAVLGGVSGHAQGPQTAAERRGNELIAAAVKALGGDNFLHMQDRIESGRAYSFYREQISGLSVAKIYTRYITIPQDKSGEQIGQRERQAFGKDEDSAIVFNENGGWEINWLGSKELPKDSIDRYHNTTLRNVLYILRERLKEPGLIIESRGADIVDHQPVDIVDITDSENRVVKVYLHQSTRLPVRQQYLHYNPQTKEQDEEVTIFARYRDVGDGIQWPLQIRRERNGEKVYEIFSETVSVNQDLTDDLFTTPGPGDKITPRTKKKK